MIIVSQNAVNYNIKLPNDSVFRINLAWCDSLQDLENILKRNKGNTIFLDLPIGRIKPPNNKYSLEELIPIIKTYKEIKYFAVSNVETSKDLADFLKYIPEDVNIVLKI